MQQFESYSLQEWDGVGGGGGLGGGLDMDRPTRFETC